MISKVELRSAIERFPIVKYLREFAADEVQPGEWATTCPVCLKEKLIVNEYKKRWHCWYCEKLEVGRDGKLRAVEGAGGLLDLIQILENVDRGQAIARVLYGNTCSVEELQEIPSQDIVTGLLSVGFTPQPVAPPPYWSMIFLDGSMAYLVKRGITEVDARVYGLMHCTAGMYAQRLIFPVWEMGHLVYWQARAMWDCASKDKMRNPPKAPGTHGKSDYLFNVETAAQYERVCLVEGGVDCIHAGYDAVATFGKIISPTQIAKLILRGVRCIDLMWDPDAEAEMDGVLPLLCSFFSDVKKVMLPSGDPGDYPRAYLQELRRRAPSVSTPRLALLG